MVEKVASKLKVDNIVNRILKTGENAYHFQHMLPVGQVYEQLLTDGLGDIEKTPSAKLTRSSGPVRWVSSVSPEEEADASHPGYWRRNLESPVLFSQAIQKHATVSQYESVELFIDIGPHPALSGSLKQISTHSLRSTGVLASLSALLPFDAIMTMLSACSTW